MPHLGDTPDALHCSVPGDQPYRIGMASTWVEELQYSLFPSSESRVQFWGLLTVD